MVRRRQGCPNKRVSFPDSNSNTTSRLIYFLGRNKIRFLAPVAPSDDHGEFVPEHSTHDTLALKPALLDHGSGIPAHTFRIKNEPNLVAAGSVVNRLHPTSRSLTFGCRVEHNPLGRTVAPLKLDFGRSRPRTSNPFHRAAFLLAPRRAAYADDGCADRSRPAGLAEEGRTKIMHRGLYPSEPPNTLMDRGRGAGVWFRPPSLRTGRADLPHPALQSVGSFPRLAR